MNNKINLNDISIPNDNYDESDILKNYSLDKEYIHVYFKNIKNKLIEKINQYDVILGCVAWLTDFEIIEALSHKQTAIIVQKEDFLRPDINERGGEKWRRQLRNAYNKLKFDYCRFNFNNIMNSLSYATDLSVAPVRCVGNHNRDKKSAFPRMHNKFLIFCNVSNGVIFDEVNCDIIVPKAVWTGSYNFTKNAGLSFENALYIEDSDIAAAYYNEFGQIAALSEQLDWESDWVEPEWRIGS